MLICGFWRSLLSFFGGWVGLQSCHTQLQCWGCVVLCCSWGCDNYQDNICPGNICPYQKYLRCYRPDVDQTLKVGSWNNPLWWYLFSQHLSWWHLSIYEENLSCYQINCDQTVMVDSKSKFDFLFLEPDHFTHICWTQNFFGPNFFLDLNVFEP